MPLPKIDERKLRRQCYNRWRNFRNIQDGKLEAPRAPRRYLFREDRRMYRDWFTFYPFRIRRLFYKWPPGSDELPF